MTHFLQRSALALLATTALCAAVAPASAAGLTPKYPIRLSPAEAAAATPVAQPAVLRGDDGPTQLILAAHRRHHSTPKAAEPPPPPETYEVKKGDTLEKIAKTLGTSIDELKAANGLKKSALQPGQTLKNPNAVPPAKTKTSKAKGGKAKAEPEAPPEPTTYTVKRGETLFAISQKTHVSVDALRKANGLSAKAQIKAGATLKLPGSAEAAAPPVDDTPAPSKKGARGRTAVADAAPEGRPGRVVDVDGPGASYKVRSGDNLSKVARKLNTTVEQLKDDNKLKGGAIRPGQTLRGPHSTAKAYVAVSGDTVDEVARRFGVTAKALRAKNGYGRRTSSLKAGQKIRLPDGYRDRGATRSSPSSTPSRDDYTPPTIRPSTPSRGDELPSRPQPYVPSGDTPIVTRPTTPYTPPGNGPAAVPVPSAALTDAQVADMGKGRFIWPLQGTILSGFGPKPGGQKNDGINIQADSGAVVRAAADGTVVYAGDQVPGFGNLVLLQHSDGWVTAYGHLSHIDVKNRQQISQGQQVGLAGATGGVPEPQLHFEVRLAPAPKDRALPIDPKLVLPK